MLKKISICLAWFIHRALNNRSKRFLALPRIDRPSTHYMAVVSTAFTSQLADCLQKTFSLRLLTRTHLFTSPFLVWVLGLTSWLSCLKFEMRGLSVANIADKTATGLSWLSIKTEGLTIWDEAGTTSQPRPTWKPVSVDKLSKKPRPRSRAASPSSVPPASKRSLLERFSHYVCDACQGLGHTNINLSGLARGIALSKILHTKPRMPSATGSETWRWEVLWHEVKSFVNNYWERFLDYIGAKLSGFKSMAQSLQISIEFRMKSWPASRLQSLETLPYELPEKILRCLDYIVTNLFGFESMAQSSQISDNESLIKPRATSTLGSLEALPYELRDNILRCIPDFTDLMSLVQASPVFLRMYLENKKSLLAGHLKMSLDTGVMTDALALQKASTLRVDKSVDRDKVQEQLNNYKNLRDRDGSTIGKPIDGYSEDAVLGMFLFWHTYARPLTVHFARLFLCRFDPQRPPIFTHLSPTENTRLLRALYRFELYSCLFGGESRHLQLNYKEEEVLKHFFCLFRPWEVEEIFSVYTLVHDEMTTRLRMMEKNLFHAVTNEFALAGGAASWGLRGFNSALGDVNFYSMITIRPGNQWTPGYGFMENVLGQGPQRLRRRSGITEHDLAQDRGDPLPYVGESESEPPYGWVLVCNGKYLNAYGGDVRKPSPRDWGYVFWDRWRLIEFKGDRKLKSTSWVPGAGV
ncbi:uncharacterized protein PODANS_2_8910 [Podospora anserina S mat+]|uniref:Podospora anserina S mat+ genomic DNA chromosome 2, supercontig 2 n=1 Tax=Podospora anserina (strain S / ATCC MYA-4624 / DSM 980 / FGSC 10383) TaxID=515849 RepID=B2B6T5_PODAN|nr:uncharacterized protein PODANS_2_8910 [Podospora anserina S mat+]CAP73512.1 unnamed protein product [Podospora anserina S mat+]CDP25914.1 Putative protein of unknown function [Podospora anserina S mat+]